MAAHSLTIANQILSIIERYKKGEDVYPVRYAEMALNAPGLDPITYPCLRMDSPTLLGPDLYHALYMAANGLIDANGVGNYGLTDDQLLPPAERIPFIETACKAIAARCAHLAYYRSLEAADSAHRLFIRRGKPYWKKRDRNWRNWEFKEAPQPESCYR